MDDITVIRLHSLGDVVMSQPVVSALADTGMVNFITSARYAPLVGRMPGVISPVHFNPDDGPIGLRRLINDLGPGSIVDLQNNVTTRIATAGFRVHGRFRTNRRQRKRVLSGIDCSMNFRSRDFLAAAGIDSDETPVLRRMFKPPEDRFHAGIVAGGRWLMKSLPVGVISELSRILIDIHGAELTIIGGPDDRCAVERVIRDVDRQPVSKYIGEAGIEGLLGCIESMDLLISPDSGPAHMASALGVPVLVVFTSTSPLLGFWRRGGFGYFMAEDVDCRPCHKHGGVRCPEEHEKCRAGLIPRMLVEKAMDIAGR